MVRKMSILLRGHRVMDNQLLNPLVSDVKNILDTARNNVAREVNSELIVAYWKIGEIIVRYEQNDSRRRWLRKDCLRRRRYIYCR